MTQSLNVRKFAGYAAIAAILNSIIFLIAKGADATMVVNQGGSQEIALPMVLASTLFGLVAAAFIASRIGKKSQGFLSKSLRNQNKMANNNLWNSNYGVFNHN